MYGLGIHEVAPYFMTLGLMEPSSTTSLVVRKDKWEALPPDLQAIVEAAVAQWSREHLHLGEIADRKAREAMLAAGNTEVFPTDEERAEVRKIAMEIWEDWAGRSPMAARVHESLVEFMRFLGVI
jgi:TRAP-type mannitol/chloroaromatic compound transport system substrate-binding protein